MSRDAEQARRVGAVALGLLERVADELALECFHLGRETPPTDSMGSSGRGAQLWRKVAFLDRPLSGQHCRALCSFSSSLTLPGHGYSVSLRMASGAMDRSARPPSCCRMC